MTDITDNANKLLSWAADEIARLARIATPGFWEHSSTAEEILAWSDDGSCRGVAGLVANPNTGTWIEVTAPELLADVLISWLRNQAEADTPDEAAAQFARRLREIRS